jgi:hypothetical protein
MSVILFRGLGVFRYLLFSSAREPLVNVLFPFIHRFLSNNQFKNPRGRLQ